MLAFSRRNTPKNAPRHPWEVAHAAPEDRAVGLELELIELVRQRNELVNDPGRAAQLDGEIAELLMGLDAVSDRRSDIPGLVA